MNKEVLRPVERSENEESFSNQWKELFGPPSVSIWVFDAKGTIISVNDVTEKNNGFRVKDIIGKDLEYLRKKNLFDRLITPEILKTKKQLTIIQYAKYSKKHMVVTGTPIFDKTGNVIFVIVNSYDITQLQILKEELDQGLQQMERLKSEIVDLNAMEINENEIVASSEKMKEVLKLAFKLSRIETSDILILGDSGTGKSLLAKFIHKNSKTKGKPFIQINCAALPETLLEAELFGYEKGAFTGAKNVGKVGLFELAQGGTLFLDEIGDLPLSIQAKLLKWLDDHEIMPLGSVKSKQINCTVITATNRDLEKLVKKKLFRKDLFYRLNTFTIRIPPLRERPEDVLGLIKFFLNKYNKKYKMKKQITEEGFDLLRVYNFPGNVRELENIIKNAMVMSEKDSLDHFIKKTISPHFMKPTDFNDIKDHPIKLKDEMLNLEKNILEQAMISCKSTREIARHLGVSQPTIIRKLRNHRLTVETI